MYSDSTRDIILKIAFGIKKKPVNSRFLGINLVKESKRKYIGKINES